MEGWVGGWMGGWMDGWGCGVDILHIGPQKCARQHPREGFNDHITCDLGIITAQEMGNILSKASFL